MNALRYLAQVLCLLALSTALALAGFALWQPPLADLDQVPVWRTGAADLSAAMKAAGARKDQQPRQFAVALPLPLAVTDGRWSSTGQQATWRARVTSAGAVMLSLEFEHVVLPQGAELRIYDPQGEMVRGPYTRTDVTADSRLWTALIRGDTAVIEVDLPVGEQNLLSLQLALVQHAFAPLGSAEVPDKAGGTSSSCEINAACPAGNDWRDEIRSVAMITASGSAGSFECTGTLLNDVPQDNTPYLLTANHCGFGTSGEPAASVTVYWNYQALNCAGTRGSLKDAQTGAAVVASNTNSDFALLRLDAPPLSSYNVYYAGWDVAGSNPQSGVSIHQPENDIKKISVYDTAASAQQITLGLMGGVDTAVWSVNWSQGVTEAGSSGSPLFDQNHHVVGNLSGGLSSCDQPTDVDHYGRLAVGWAGDPGVSAQLKAHLDPHAAGTTVLCGRDASAADCSPGSGSSGDSGGDGSGGSKSGGGSSSPALLVFLGASLFFRKRITGAKT